MLDLENFDTTKFDSTFRSVAALEQLQEKIKTHGVSRADIQYALEAAEFYKLPERYPLQSFTAEVSKTNMSIALETMSTGKQIGISVITGLVVGIITKLLHWFLSGGSSGSSSSGGGGGFYPKLVTTTLAAAERTKTTAAKVEEMLANLDSPPPPPIEVLEELKAITDGSNPLDYLRDNVRLRVGIELFFDPSQPLAKTARAMTTKKMDNIVQLYIGIVETYRTLLYDMKSVGEAVAKWDNTVPEDIDFAWRQLGIPTRAMKYADEHNFFGFIAALESLGLDKHTRQVADENAHILPNLPHGKYALILTSALRDLKDKEFGTYLNQAPNYFIDVAMKQSAPNIVSVKGTGLENWSTESFTLDAIEGISKELLDDITKLTEQVEEVFSENGVMLAAISEGDDHASMEKNDTIVNHWKSYTAYKSVYTNLFQSATALLTLAKDITTSVKVASDFINEYNTIKLRVLKEELDKQDK